MSTEANDSYSRTIDVLPTEIDNHADTHCFGKKIIPFSWSGLVCSVSPFLQEYGSVEDIEICSGATAYTTSLGETIILIFGQGLWFGDRMDKSLINPNQCRAYGIPVCDDPTDPYRSLGFQILDDDIPLVMEGTTALMYTRTPTRLELDECKKYYLSDPDQWDPIRTTFPEMNVSMLRRDTADKQVRQSIPQENRLVLPSISILSSLGHPSFEDNV